jgi:catalase (peroxidase I)
MLVSSYKNDIAKLEDAFSKAWYKLTTRDMGPHVRCVGNKVPPPQPFQNPLPQTSAQLADFTSVKGLLQSHLDSNADSIAAFIHLAYQCASTFRRTDYLGGCNGARILLSPEKDWKVNRATGDIFNVLKDNVISKYSGAGALSSSDSIVLAGTFALEKATGKSFQFCPGRTDTTDGTGSEFLLPRIYDESAPSVTLAHVKDLQEISALSPREMIALQGRIRSNNIQKTLGYSGSWGKDSAVQDNSFFVNLISGQWELQQNGDVYEYASANLDGTKSYITPQDYVLLIDFEYRSIVEQYAVNNTLFLEDFSNAWTKLMNADRFSGPNSNLCAINSIPAGTGGNSYTIGEIVGTLFGGIGLGLLIGYMGYKIFGQKASAKKTAETNKHIALLDDVSVKK